MGHMVLFFVIEVVSYLLLPTGTGTKLLMSTDESHPLSGVHSDPSDLAAPTVTTPGPNGTVVPEPSKDNDGPPLFTTKPVWDFDEMKFPQQETTIREYLEAMPRADESGNWNVEEAKTWLDQSMVRIGICTCHLFVLTKILY
jgi:hypothetical protein